jgi:hypothetical protein
VVAGISIKKKKRGLEDERREFRETTLARSRAGTMGNSKISFP